MKQEAAALCAQLAQRLLARRERAATAESCTGGLLAARFTDLAGSSEWFDRGFVTYSNEAKTELLGVPSALILRFGAVSEEVVRSMALGARARSRAQWAVSISGVAGPSGGTREKPVGTVWMAWAGPSGEVFSALFHFAGDRAAVREAAIAAAVEGLLARIPE